jgi:hypothetical protein
MFPLNLTTPADVQNFINKIVPLSDEDVLEIFEEQNQNMDLIKSNISEFKEMFDGENPFSDIFDFDLKDRELIIFMVNNVGLNQQFENQGFDLNDLTNNQLCSIYSEMSDFLAKQIYSLDEQAVYDAVESLTNQSQAVQETPA